MKTKNTADWSLGAQLSLRLSRSAFRGLSLVLMLLLLGPSAAVGATFSLVHSFNETDCFSPNNDGDLIVALTLAKDGNIYGMAAGGGPFSCFNGPYGTIFRVAPDGTFSTLYAFSGPDGAGPGAGDTDSISETGFSLSGGPLVQGADGSLYGTTIGGGQPLDPCCILPRGEGTIFKITPDGNLTTLFIFDGTNGSGPVCLLLAKDGYFYGTTAPHNLTSPAPPAVFRTSPDGALTNLVVFDGTNGSGAARSLIQGKDGNLYGTTDYGGAYGRGTVFKMTLDGVLTTVASFRDTNASPPYSIMQASDGCFYGTMRGGGRYTCVTINGGQYCEYPGTIFKLSPDGTLTNLVLFNNSNGALPTAALLEGTDGNFYGTTSGGGLLGLPCGGYDPNGLGTLFKMSPQGKLTTLFRFNGPNGYYPTASLIQATDGSFYGTTLFGGTNSIASNCVGDGPGTVFRLTVAGATSPKILGAAQSGDTLSLSWLALVGRSYQLQFATNVAETNWFNAGASITATNTMMTTSDTSGSDSQRFYRVVLLP
jgi:uncharacterized repeat protein (TIGR03803 family)